MIMRTLKNINLTPFTGSFKLRNTKILPELNVNTSSTINETYENIEIYERVLPSP